MKTAALFAPDETVAEFRNQRGKQRLAFASVSDAVAVHLFFQHTCFYEVSQCTGFQSGSIQMSQRQRPLQYRQTPGRDCHEPQRDQRSQCHPE